MKYWFSIFFICTLTFHVTAQNYYYPAPHELYGQLYDDVQSSGLFPDSKTFIDCEARMDPGMIINEYEMTDKSTIDLKQFVLDHFRLPAETPAFNYVKQEEDLSKHIGNVWSILMKDVTGPYDGMGSLLEVPYSYVVPGGRYREIHYMESYFTMLGMKESRQDETIQNMVDIFTDAITRYGFIPQGFRTYYMSRSQIPFYSMMIEMLAEMKGESIYLKYLPAMEMEYAYWMEGAQDLKPGQADKRVVRLKDGTYLNRYWDDLDIPRAENYLNDVEMVEKTVNVLLRNLNLKLESQKIKTADSLCKSIYRNLRAASSSGWDSGERWISDVSGLIETTDILPVDLNAMMMKLEAIIQKARKIKGDKQLTAGLYKRAEFDNYFWNENLGYYTDYHFTKNKKRTSITLSGMFPFCFEIGNIKDRQMKAKSASLVLKAKLLKPGGLLTEPSKNKAEGMAHLQWMCVKGLESCGQSTLAKDIAERWINLNQTLYLKTGKVFERYELDENVSGKEDKNKGYDAFGPTNGVYLSLKEMYGGYRKY